LGTSRSSTPPNRGDGPIALSRKPVAFRASRRSSQPEPAHPRARDAKSPQRRANAKGARPAESRIVRRILPPPMPPAIDPRNLIQPFRPAKDRLFFLLNRNPRRPTMDAAKAPPPPPLARSRVRSTEGPMIPSSLVKGITGTSLSPTAKQASWWSRTTTCTCLRLDVRGRLRRSRRRAVSIPVFRVLAACPWSRRDEWPAIFFDEPGDSSAILLTTRGGMHGVADCESQQPVPPRGRPVTDRSRAGSEPSVARWSASCPGPPSTRFVVGGGLSQTGRRRRARNRCPASLGAGPRAGQGRRAGSGRREGLGRPDPDQPYHTLPKSNITPLPLTSRSRCPLLRVSLVPLRCP